MLNKESERKFLVNGPAFLAEMTNPVSEWTILSHQTIVQIYLTDKVELTSRIRRVSTVTDNSVSIQFYLTVKANRSSDGITCDEYETELTDMTDTTFHTLFNDLYGICKTRTTLQGVDGRVWTVDIFGGLNRSLVLAEVEFDLHDTSELVIPEWTTQEVTGDPRYYNSQLIQSQLKSM